MQTTVTQRPWLDGSRWTPEAFDEAFTKPVSDHDPVPVPVPYDVPSDIRCAAERICMSYRIRGICDPMYIANLIAKALGRGDGQSNFWDAA